MRTAGIICEYNPFHTGHMHQIDVLRSMGYDCVICVMSGNYTQRGELAIFDKYTRAEAAIRGGADIVVELPFPFSSLSAEGFANAGVYILSSLGIDAISFGSECGDISMIERAANTICSPEFASTYNDLQCGGIGSAAAYFEAIKIISGDDISLLSNDILGISYVAAIKKLGANLKILPIKREGAAYNDKNLSSDKYPSASALREAIKNSSLFLGQIPNEYILESSLSVFLKATDNGIGPIYQNNIYREILSFFKFLTPDEITARAKSRSGGGNHVAEDGCGILERISNAALSANSYDAFIDSCYSSKYTKARINRVILFSMLGVSDKLSHSHPEYTTLLGANEIGRKLLAELRKTYNFDIVTKPADAPENSLQKIVSEAADVLYTSAMPQNQCPSFFVKSRPFIIK